MFAAKPVNRERIITWSLMLGAIFPDSDVFREFFSHNDLLILTWHRSITHSLVCLPIFAVAFAALTRWFVRWRKWDAPSFGVLIVIYAVGILSHILLDLVTSFGTMVWSPVKWSRPAWDLIFIIIDFTLTRDSSRYPRSSRGSTRKKKDRGRRALGSWLVFAAATFGVAAIVLSPWARPFRSRAILAAIAILAGAVFLCLPFAIGACACGSHRGIWQVC